MTHLALTHLRFDCTTTSPIKFSPYMAGNALRNGLANIMLKATCPDRARQAIPTPEHAATCPACYLLAAETEPGAVVRNYAMIPPLPDKTYYKVGEPFHFGLTLFGEASQFLPYFILATEALGRTGLGLGRGQDFGQFQLQQVTAINPFSGAQQILLSPVSRFVQAPQIQTTWASMTEQLPRLVNGSTLTLHFHTPTRLEEKEQLFKQADFGVFFRRLLFRIDQLNRQYADAPRRGKEEVDYFYGLADKVRLVESRLQWQTLWTNSQRKETPTPLSGFTGSATYVADDWEPLRPWLAWGQAIQVGKSVVRGNGVYEIASADSHWAWMKGA